MTFDSAPAPRVLPRAESVLIADTNICVRQACATVLQHRGYQVYLASNGPEALRVARSERPRIILLDLELDGVNGWEVAAVLTAQETVHPCALGALSADPAPPRVEEALRHGFDACLAKPFSVDEFWAVLAELSAVADQRSASATQCHQPPREEGSDASRTAPRAHTRQGEGGEVRERRSSRSSPDDSPRTPQ